MRKKKMKMTPEQKAFYECGKSVESVRETIQKIRQHAIHEFGEPYYLLMPSEKRFLRMATDLAGKIHTVRQKRAACRAWQVKERYCGNCKYSDYSEWGVPCCECSHANIVESLDRWEPRKEDNE
jgi:hypothetical protein